MQTKNYTEAIFNTQLELNKYIFSKRQLDTSIWENRDSTDDSVLETWLLKFLRATNQEVFELEKDLIFIKELKHTDKVLQNTRVEAIDIIHFVVSMCLLVDMKPEELKYNDIFKNVIPRGEIVPTIISRSIYFLRDRIFEIENQLNWKWWSNYEPIDRDKIKELLESMLLTLTTLCSSLNLTPEDIWSVYKQKVEVNRQRQLQNYSRSTKTEEDNESIVTGVKNNANS